MENDKLLIYDGSFNGFLSAVFIAFDQKWPILDIQKDNGKQKGLFSETEIIPTDITAAKRVWLGIEKKGHEIIKSIYFAFQSESKGVELLLFRYVSQLFLSTPTLSFTEHDLSKIKYLSKLVAAEKRHMEAYVDLFQSKDLVHYAVIAPDYDVLPLISKHFRSKYRDQQWLIYDSKRGYGIYYEGFKVELISLDLGDYYKNPDFYQKLSRNEGYGVTDISNGYLKNIEIQAHIIPKNTSKNRRREDQPFINERAAV